MVAVSGCFKWNEGERKILAVDFQVLWIPVPLKLTTEGERSIASVMPRFMSEWW